MENIPVRHIEQYETQSSNSYSIRDISSALDGSDMLQELHRHDFFYLLILKKGSGIHEIDFISHNINDHTVFIMRPGQVHFLDLKTKSIAYIMRFKTDFLYSHNNASQNHLTRLIQSNIYQLEPEGFAKIENLVKEALKEFTEKVKGYQEVLKANLSILLIELLRQRKATNSINTLANSYAQEKLEQFLESVESNACTQKQVSYYTDFLHLSSYQLSAITKSLLNKTPSEIINEYLILEAKRQLLATTNQVSQIAYKLGYEDASYFTRFFKKHTGLTPENFRNNSR